MNGAASGSGPNSVSGGSERFQGSIEGSPRFAEFFRFISDEMFNLNSPLLTNSLEFNKGRHQMAVPANWIRALRPKEQEASSSVAESSEQRVCAPVHRRVRLRYRRPTRRASSGIRALLLVRGLAAFAK